MVRSRGPGFKSQWRQTSAHALNYAEPFIISLPSSRYDFNNVERDVKYQILIICYVFDRKRYSGSTLPVPASDNVTSASSREGGDEYSSEASEMDTQVWF